MRRSLPFLLLALLSCAQPSPATGPASPSSPVQIFNGKNLDGWYTWLREHRHEDPNKVFSVADGQIRISGQDWGGITTKDTYRDYHLIVEWRYGGKVWPPRETKARDSGILVHAVGEDGVGNPTWLESIESQIIEGGTGDFIMVGGAGKPSLTTEVRTLGKELYWQTGAETVTRNSGRFNWWGRDPEWRDELNFRGPKDVEKPVGEWNVHEIIADGDKITCILNGVVVNYGYNSSHTEGKIQIQSEGAEILIRRVELRPITTKPEPRSPDAFTKQ
ncbi:MAG: DUF1080 domain-containing protein [Bryobacterales bacterium]|nr:DUF1080 domain-containing protein [Bryobacterales bacterium]